MEPKKNGGVMILGVVCAALAMMFGDYLYPQGGQELGRLFGAIKGGIGFAIGAGLWLLGSYIFKRA
jgi:lipopolysaccharide export LptBFGC system permease protein LptF